MIIKWCLGNVFIIQLIIYISLWDKNDENCHCEKGGL